MADRLAGYLSFLSRCKGRVVHSREVGSLGGGSHVLPLAGATPLGPGMYWLRLTHPERTLTTKGLVVR